MAFGPSKPVWGVPFGTDNSSLQQLATSPTTLIRKVNVNLRATVFLSFITRWKINLNQLDSSDTFITLLCSFSCFEQIITGRLYLSDSICYKMFRLCRLSVLQ